MLTIYRVQTFRQSIIPFGRGHERPDDDYTLQIHLQMDRYFKNIIPAEDLVMNDRQVYLCIAKVVAIIYKRVGCIRHKDLK